MTKSNDTYAVIRCGGRQFKVSAGDTIVVDRIHADVGETITLDDGRTYKRVFLD